MRAMATCLLVAMLWLGQGPARADDAALLAAGDRRAIEQVIAGQIDAFRHDAADAAFAHASPKIQSLFGDAATFLAMVRRDYQPVYRPCAFRFEDLVTIDARIVQRVVLIAPDGTPALALYTMEREPDGTWRIDACELTQATTA